MMVSEPPSSILRAAAKNFRDVLVVVDPADYPRVIEALDREGGPAPTLRFELARKAFAHTAAYDGTIATTLEAASLDEVSGAFERRTVEGAPAALRLSGRKIGDLRYGENPHQPGAWYTDGSGSGLGVAEVLQGKGLSYTNLLDLDAAARIVLEFTEPAASVVKHTNPCGAATGASIADAYVRAREADALSAFGGIVGLNRALDVETATAIASTFIEAVVAPGVDEAARSVIRQAGYGDCFGHGLGHGIGIEVHESPRVSSTSTDVLIPGTVISIEPGIYIPNWGGVRIEDLIAITQDGFRNLMKSPKHLIEWMGE